MPVINGVYLKDFTALPGAVADANIIPIAITGDQVAYRTTVGGIVTDARVTSKLLTGLSVTGSAILATDTILQAFGKVQNQLNGKQGTITLTTTGTSGPSTLVGNTLNIPNYADGGVLSLSAIGAVPNANAATITGTVLNLQPASSSFGGVITTGSQTIAGDKTLTGALIGTTGSFSSSGGSDTFSINHSSGAGIALNITKGGNGEGIYVNKTSGSGNAVTIIGTLNATTLVKSGGTSAQFLKADGTVDSTTYQGAITLTTTGTSGAATFISNTLNIPDYGSALSGYLPLTGGTLTGALSGTSATFTGTTLSGVVKGIATSGFGVSGEATSGNAVAGNATTGVGGVFIANNTGGVGLIADSYTGVIAKFQASGSDKVTIANTGALSGTSASFSSTVAASAFIPSGSTVATNGMYLSAANTLAFSTNSTNRIVISSDGDVGIGSSTISNPPGIARVLNISNASNSGLVLTQGANNYSLAVVSNIFRIYKEGTEKFSMDSDGVVTIVNLAGTGSRAVFADSNGVLSAPVSDISVKQNIKPIGYGLNEIMKMNPVWFNFIDEYKNFGEGRQNGNIAQEMAEIIPEAVFVTASTGKMGISYDQLHAVYIKAIQELKKEIDILKNK
jgi:hypothetical protein